MKRLSITLLVLMVGMSSCAICQKEKNAEESTPSSFLPKPLDDEWSQWIAGSWQVSGESDSGKGQGWMKIELALNGQFLIYRYETKITEMTPEQKQYLKENVHASDEDIERFLSLPFEGLEIYTIDLETGEIVGYLFDSLRCIAKGTGKRQGNKETMEWEWSGRGSTSVRITEKLSDNKVVITERITMADGSTMDEKCEMTRKR